MKSMFAYICLGSNDLERSAKFYDAEIARYRAIAKSINLQPQ